MAEKQILYSHVENNREMQELNQQQQKNTDEKKSSTKATNWIWSLIFWHGLERTNERHTIYFSLENLCKSRLFFLLLFEIKQTSNG